MVEAAAELAVGQIVGQLHNVSAAYHGDIYVLRDLNVTFRSGTVTGIIGPNGAGKSTVLRTFVGLLRPRQGEVRLYGRATDRIATHELASLGVGYVPQNRSLFLDLSVEDNLLLGCWSFRKDAARVRQAVAIAVDAFPELGGRLRVPAGSLSGGQRRFLEIARALMLQPKILLLDEPTAMIAPKFAAEVYRKIIELAKQGLAVVLVDQNVRPCVRASNYLYVMELGRKTAEGPTDGMQSDAGLRDMISRWLDVSGG